MKPTLDQRRTVTVAAVLLAFIAGWLGLMSLKLTTNATDVPRYHAYGTAMRAGSVPYRDFRVEYPPAALPTFVLPTLARTSYHGYRIAFELLMALCGCGLLVTTTLILVRLGDRLAPALAFVAAATLALGPIVLGHYDLWPALLVSGALAALLWDRAWAAAVLLGLAVAAKIYAVVLLPLAVVWVWRRAGRRAALQRLGVAVGTTALCFLPFFIASPGGLMWSLTEQARRPLQFESTAAAVLLAAHQLFSLSIGVEFSHSSVNLGGKLPAAAAAATVAFEALVLTLTWVLFARGPLDARRLVRASTAAVLAFVLLGKVFSPQFLIWLIPLAPLLGGSLALFGSAVVGAAAVFTRLYFPGQWRDLIRFEATPTALLVIRNGLLLCLLAALLFEVARSRHERS